MVHIFSQALLDDIHNVALCCSYEIWQSHWENNEKESQREKAPFSPLHSWPIRVWSGCECQIVGFSKLQKLLDTVSERCGKFLKFFDRPTSSSDGVHWHLKSGKRRKINVSCWLRKLLFASSTVRLMSSCLCYVAFSRNLFYIYLGQSLIEHKNLWFQIILLIVFFGQKYDISM